MVFRHRKGQGRQVPRCSRKISRLNRVERRGIGVFVKRENGSLRKKKCEESAKGDEGPSEGEERKSKCQRAGFGNLEPCRNGREGGTGPSGSVWCNEAQKKKKKDARCSTSGEKEKVGVENQNNCGDHASRAGTKKNGPKGGTQRTAGKILVRCHLSTKKLL